MSDIPIPISELPELTEAPHADDWLVVVDRSDVAVSVTGETKKVKKQYVSGGEGLTLVGVEVFRSYNESADGALRPSWSTAAHNDVGDGAHDRLIVYMGNGDLPLGSSVGVNDPVIGRPWQTPVVLGESFTNYNPDWVENSWNGNAAPEDWTNIFALPHGFYRTTIEMVTYNPSFGAYSGQMAFDYTAGGPYADVYSSPQGDAYYGEMLSGHFVNFAAGGSGQGYKRSSWGTFVLSEADAPGYVDSGRFSIIPPDVRTSEVFLSIAMTIERYA